MWTWLRTELAAQTQFPSGAHDLLLENMPSGEYPSGDQERVDAAMTKTGKYFPRSLSLRNKLLRACWQIVWLVLFRPTPSILHPWRRLLLRLFGAKLAEDVHVYPSVRVWAPWNLNMGRGSGLGPYVDCYCVDHIAVGQGAAVSQYAFLCTATKDYRHLSMPLMTAPIYIGPNAWIAADVFVGPGVSIGEGAVVEARSTVLSDLPAWTVSAGHPARVIRARVVSESEPQNPEYAGPNG